MSTLSVVVPVHNRWPLVERTLASIETQTHLPDHLIIVDNASAPSVAVNLASIATRLSEKMRVTLISCPTPGAPSARNAGLEIVDTDYTMFFDSDDIMLPDHIARAMAMAEANPQADIVGWDSVFVDSEGKILRYKRFPSHHLLYHAIMHGSLATQSYMARTELFRHAGGWNPQAKIWNDLELSVRLLLEHPTIIKAKSGTPKVHILTHDNSITGSDFASRAAERDHTLDLLISLSQKTHTPEIIPIVALKRAILAGCCRREGKKEIAEKLFSRALTLPVSGIQKTALRFSYLYTSLSLPGAARLLQPLFV